MMRRIALASLVLASGCATLQEAQSPDGITGDRMRITNQFPFDTAVCQSQAPTLPQPVNQNVLVGALFSSQPEVMECLADPKSRGDAKKTHVVVKATLNDQGGTHTVSGENLTPEGQACIQKALDTRVPLAALPKGAQPVEYQTEFNHDQETGASVKLGINAGSDFSGAVRLGQPSWCDCYAGFANKVPPSLKATVSVSAVTKPKSISEQEQEQAVSSAQAATLGEGKQGDAASAKKAAEEAKKKAQIATTITFEPAGTPEGDQLAACLQAKMMAIPAALDPNRTQLKFVYRFTHLNSRATEPAADMPPELRFFQLDLMRGQRSAEAAIAIGGRDNAAAAYDAVVATFGKQTDRKKQNALLPELTTKCTALVSAAQHIVDAITTQLQVDQQSLTLTQELKAKDPSYTEIETRLQEAVKATEQDLANAQKRLQEDQAICEKLKPKF